MFSMTTLEFKIFISSAQVKKRLKRKEGGGFEKKERMKEARKG